MLHKGKVVTSALKQRIFVNIMFDMGSMILRYNHKSHKGSLII